MYRFGLLILSFSVFVLLSFPAQAQVEKYSFDKAHTQILFFADHLGFSKSQGEFHDYDGYFVFNRSEPAKSYVEVNIKTDSIDMDHDRWNEHMRNADFFDVPKHPEMIFRSTNINVLDERTADITGLLTLLGVSKPVVLHANFNKAGRHPFNQKFVAGFSAYAKIKRSEWGMTYGLPMLGDDIEIRIEVEGIREEKAGQEQYNQ